MVDRDILSAEAKTGFSRSYAGINTALNLTGGSVSIFDLQIGVGIDSGAGIKDDSITLKIAGTGIQVGRKISVSVLGSSFGADLGRLFS